MSEPMLREWQNFDDEPVCSHVESERKLDTSFSIARRHRDGRPSDHVLPVKVSHVITFRNWKRKTLGNLHLGMSKLRAYLSVKHLSFSINRFAFYFI